MVEVAERALSEDERERFFPRREPFRRDLISSLAHHGTYTVFAVGLGGGIIGCLLRELGLPPEFAFALSFGVAILLSGTAFMASRRRTASARAAYVRDVERQRGAATMSTWTLAPSRAWRVLPPDADEPDEHEADAAILLELAADRFATLTAELLPEGDTTVPRRLVVEVVHPLGHVQRVETVDAQPVSFEAAVVDNDALPCGALDNPFKVLNPRAFSAELQAALGITAEPPPRTSPTATFRRLSSVDRDRYLDAVLSPARRRRATPAQQDNYWLGDPPRIDATEEILSEGDEVDIVGYGEEVVDASVEEHAPRQVSVRTVIRGTAAEPVLLRGRSGRSEAEERGPWAWIGTEA